jgi:hypothetical protein
MCMGLRRKKKLGKKLADLDEAGEGWIGVMLALYGWKMGGDGRLVVVTC